MFSKLYLFFAGVMACLGPFCCGVLVGWSSQTYDAVNDSSILGFHVTEEQLDWIASFLLLGSMMTFLPAGFISKIIGPKCAMFVAVIPAGCGWACLLCGSNYKYALVGRFLLGLAAGFWFVCCRVYLIHIAEIKVRGMLGVLYQMQLCNGATYSYLFGAILPDITVFHFVCIIPFGCFAFGLLFLPESPVYYTYKQNVEKAREALQRFRGENADVNEELLELIEYCEKIKSQNISIWAHLNTKSHRKAFCLCFILVILHQFSGTAGFTFYITQIFIQARIAGGPKYLTIFYGASAVPFIIIAFVLIDQIGRRKLLIASGTMGIIFGSIFALYFLMANRYYEVGEYNAIPILSIILYSGGFQLGIGPITFLVVAELFEENIRGIALGICSTVNYAIFFLVVSFFLQIVNLIGLGSIMLVCVCSDALLVVFTLFFLPETKRKTYAQIEASMMNSVSK